jgi:SAM-dependent methyltransferase
MITPSDYYKQSVEIGQHFQKNNPKKWVGNDSKSYHKYIRFLMDRYAARTVLDYGCGKGQQYIDVVPYGLPGGAMSEPMTFQTRINAESVYKYDPCVLEFDQEPVEQKFDAVICTQVLGSIPDADMSWIKHKFMMYATKFVFIGLHSFPGKSKKRIYDPAYLNPNRTVEWYQEQFSDWSGPDLYWWFRDSDATCNDWYKI